MVWITRLFAAALLLFLDTPPPLAAWDAQRLIAAGERKPLYGRALFGLAGVLATAAVLVPLLYGPMDRRDEVMMRDLEKLRVVVASRLRFRVGCEADRCAIDETHTGTTTTEVRGVAAPER